MTTRSGRQRAPLGNREKHLFSRLVLQFLLFGIDLVAAPDTPSLFKISKKALILQPFGRPACTQHRAQKGTSKIVSNGFGTSRGPKS